MPKTVRPDTGMPARGKENIEHRTSKAEHRTRNSELGTRNLRTENRKPKTENRASLARAVYPGSFDPISYGHIDLAERGLKIFDELFVAVACNLAKTTLFSAEERVDMAREVFDGVPGVTVASYDGMTVDFVRSVGANTILRGIRTVSDFEYEFQMALTNRHFADDIETVFMMTSNEYSFLSSRFIKEIAALGGDVSAFVPPLVATRLAARLAVRARGPGRRE